MSTPYLNLLLKEPGVFQQFSDGSIKYSENINLVAIDTELSRLNSALATAGFVPPPTKTLFVDKNRTDTYVADGSLLKPFKTITAAVNKLIANGDSGTNLYLIDIVGPGTYAENVDLSNANIVQLAMDGHKAVTIQPAAGDCLASTSNNTGFNSCAIRGIAFVCPITGTPSALNFQCPTNGGGFGSAIFNFYDCTFFVSGGGQLSLNLNNIVNINFYRCFMTGPVAATNVNQISVIEGDGLSTATGPTTTLVTNNALPIPAGFIGTLLLVLRSQWAGNVSIDAASNLTAIGARDIGRNGTLTVNGTYSATLSRTRGNITVNSGGNYTALGGLVTGTLTINSGATFSPQGSLAVADLYLNSKVHVTTGSGSPNTVVTGNPGDVYLNTAGGAAATLWIKESGAATNTGWVGK